VAYKEGSNHFVPCPGSNSLSSDIYGSLEKQKAGLLALAGFFVFFAYL
jgi:hypothetical protein